MIYNLAGGNKMYNDTIKAENKIISNDDLMQIFQLMEQKENFLF